VGMIEAKQKKKKRKEGQRKPHYHFTCARKRPCRRCGRSRSARKKKKKQKKKMQGREKGNPPGVNRLPRLEFSEKTGKEEKGKKKRKRHLDFQKKEENKAERGSPSSYSLSAVESALLLFTEAREKVKKKARNQKNI